MAGSRDLELISLLLRTCSGLSGTQADTQTHTRVHTDMSGVRTLKSPQTHLAGASLAQVSQLCWSWTRDSGACIKTCCMPKYCAAACYGSRSAALQFLFLLLLDANAMQLPPPRCHIPLPAFRRELINEAALEVGVCCTYDDA